MKRVITVILLIPIISGPAFSNGCSWMKSSFFKGLDGNNDASLNYPEWMKYYGSHTHSLASCSRKDFYIADCNNDEKLSWKEYYNYRFENDGICGLLSRFSGYENRSLLIQAMEQREAELKYKYFSEP